MKTPVLRRLRPLLMALSVVAFISICASACAPRVSTTSSEEEELLVEMPDFVWAADSDCAVCHEQQHASIDNQATLLGAHVVDPSVDCVTCHVDDPVLAGVHSEIGYEPAVVKRLKKTEVDQETCLDCHDQGEIAAAVPESAYLSDLNELTINPHEIPDTPGHEGENTCVSCHVAHKEVQIRAQAKENCAMCHHRGVFECGTCH